MPIEKKDPNTGASSFVPTEDEKKQLELLKKLYASTIDLDNLKIQMNAQEQATQVLQHGANIINATTPSNLGLEIQGRSLINLLGISDIAPSKYYIYLPQKGTTKITVGGNTYETLTKITGQSTPTYKIKQDFRNKVSGSNLLNGNVVKYRGLSTLVLPTDSSAVELSDGTGTNSYSRITSLDNQLLTIGGTSTSNAMGQHLFSFDIIRNLQEKYGDGIWQGKTLLADKITIAKQVLTKITCNWWGFGSSPTGNKANLSVWYPLAGSWWSPPASHTGGDVRRLTSTPSVNAIDTNGFVYFLAYAEPSNGTVSSAISTDYVEIEMETNTYLPLLEDSLYEVDKTTYDKINVDPEYSGQKLMDKFPYVQGAQHLNPIFSVEGGNLLPTVYEASEITTQISIQAPYSFRITNATTDYQALHYKMNLSPNTTYTVGFSGSANSGMYVDWYDSKGAKYGLVSPRKEKVATFTTPSAFDYISVKFSNTTTRNEDLLFENMYIYAGSQPRPFVPRSPSYLSTNTKLFGFNGVNDVMYKDNGAWKVNRVWTSLDITGDKSWIIDNYTGFKRFRYTHGIPSTDYVQTKEMVVLPEGVVIVNGNTSSFPDTTSLNTNGSFYLSLSNNRTGFNDTYNPNSDEVNAYFNGWRVKTVDSSGKPTAWVSSTTWVDSPTQTLAYVKANKAPSYVPIKLIYQVTKPRIELVQVEGELSVNGLTQVNVDSGVVVREKANYSTTTSLVYINSRTGALANKVYTILAIYKNGKIDNDWEIVLRATTEADYPIVGRSFARIKRELFDTKAEYTVTYLAQDKQLFTTNAVDVKSAYSQSVRSSLDGLNTRQVQSTTDISILQGITVDILARLKANNL